MTLRQILEEKGSEVFTIGPDARMDDVVARMVDHNCGSLVVCDGERMVGIITERDVLRTCAMRSEPLDRISVRERMSRSPVTGAPDDTLDDTMGLMTDRRIRHLPILEHGRLVGMVSIGDLVKSQHERLAFENHHLRSYLHG